MRTCLRRLSRISSWSLRTQGAMRTEHTEFDRLLASSSIAWFSYVWVIRRRSYMVRQVVDILLKVFYYLELTGLTSFLIQIQARLCGVGVVRPLYVCCSVEVCSQIAAFSLVQTRITQQHGLRRRMKTSYRSAREPDRRAVSNIGSTSIKYREARTGDGIRNEHSCCL